MNRHPDRYDNATERPWPVSPYKYPLTGPSRGPVYVPPPGGSAFRLLVTLGYLAAMTFAFGFAGYVIATHIFKGTL